MAKTKNTDNKFKLLSVVFLLYSKSPAVPVGMTTFAKIFLSQKHKKVL